MQRATFGPIPGSEISSATASSRETVRSFSSHWWPPSGFVSSSYECKALWKSGRGLPGKFLPEISTPNCLKRLSALRLGGYKPGDVVKSTGMGRNLCGVRFRPKIEFATAGRCVWCHECMMRSGESILPMLQCRDLESALNEFYANMRRRGTRMRVGQISSCSTIVRRSAKKRLVWLTSSWEYEGI